MKDVIKDFALLDEIEAATKLIKLGLGELQNINLSNDFYYLTFQLLSSGFERIMKCYICLAYFNVNNKFPEHSYLKGIGHNLLDLLNEINANYYTTDNRPIIVEDKIFLTQNDELKELINILSEFGKMARYYNLDLITGATKISIDPKKEWEVFENKIMQSNPKLYEKIMDWDLSQEVYYFISNYIIIIFEKYLGALSRQFIFGYLGDKGKQFSSTFFDFGMIYQKDLGKTDYRKITTRYKETPKKVHKRTLLDEIERKTNKSFKSLKIIKSEYVGEWPFYADEVIVECRKKHWCIITIEGYDYALNGSAKGHYKLENPHDAGVAVGGKSIGEFIKIALEL